MLEYGELEMGHARCLLMLNEQEQKQVAQLVVAKQLSVRETEKLVARIKAGKTITPAERSNPVALPAFENELQHLAKRWQTKVNIKAGRDGKGKLIIHFDKPAKLEQMLGLLMD